MGIYDVIMLAVLSPHVGKLDECTAGGGRFPIHYPALSTYTRNSLTLSWHCQLTPGAPLHYLTLGFPRSHNNTCSYHVRISSHLELSKRQQFRGNLKSLTLMFDLLCRRWLVIACIMSLNLVGYCLSVRSRTNYNFYKNVKANEKFK